jgi:capsular polysaccharide biosynthesis protein
MRRDFRELSRDGLEEGGATELARVWAATLSDLLVTAVKERGTVSARNAYLSADPKIVAKSMVTVVLVALAVTMASLSMIPEYEASNKVLIGMEDSARLTLELQRQDLQEMTLTLAEATRSRPVAEDTIERLELSTTPGVFLERLRVEPIENTQFIEVSYTDQDPRRAQVVANTVVDVLAQRVSAMHPRSSNDHIRATLWERARIPEEPVSPNPLRNGLLVLVSGLLLSVSLAFALPKIAASGTGGAALRRRGR